VFVVIDAAPIDWQSFRPKGTYRNENMPYCNAFGRRRVGQQTIVAVETATGKTLWKSARPVVPLTGEATVSGTVVAAGTLPAGNVSGRMEQRLTR